MYQFPLYHIFRQKARGEPLIFRCTPCEVCRREPKNRPLMQDQEAVRRMKGEGDQTLRWASFLTSCSILRWVLLSRDLKVEEALPMEAVSANMARKQAAAVFRLWL